jgi:predicted transposase YdaD
VDAGLHHLQGKTKRVNATQLLDTLTEFYRDKLTMRQRHIAAARLVPDYNFNNTYQYVIAREDLQLNWLRDAITDMGGNPPEIAEPTLTTTGKGAEATILQEDRGNAQSFLDKWQRRVDGITHARHRTMLKVILGETAEHRRFFEQALAGRNDLLGRRADGAGTGGGVMATRWVE